MAVTEEELYKIKRTVLTHCRKNLLILDERDCDEIKAANSRIGSAEVFVDILLRKGSSGYDGFCDALLYEKTQLFLLEQLNRTFEVLKSKVKEEKAKQRQHSHPHGLTSHQLPANGQSLLSQAQQSHAVNQPNNLLSSHHHHSSQNPHKPQMKMNSRTTPVGPPEPQEPYFPIPHQMDPRNFMNPMNSIPPMHPHFVPPWEQQIPYQPQLHIPHHQPHQPPHIPEPHHLSTYNVLASRDASVVPRQTHTRPPLHSETDDGPCGEDVFKYIPVNT